MISTGHRLTLCIAFAGGHVLGVGLSSGLEEGLGVLCHALGTPLLQVESLLSVGAAVPLYINRLPT